MQMITSKNVFHIIRKTLNLVDVRLVAHGERVAFILYKMLQYQGMACDKRMLEFVILALVHDMGAYKTEEIDQMVQFETENVWQHSIYGFLFLKNFSPMPQFADVVLYHHLPYQDLFMFLLKIKKLPCALN